MTDLSSTETSDAFVLAPRTSDYGWYVRREVSMCPTVMKMKSKIHGFVT
jgi:hypothetical protein